MRLRWTDAGRAALADGANTGTAALRLTHFALGDGQGAGGAADDGRAALRSERHRAAIKGVDSPAGRVAFRADFTPNADYGITEAGVVGTAGNPRSRPALYLYWTDGGAKAGQAANGTALAIGAAVDFQAAAADVAVTVGGKIEFGDPPGNATELKFGLTRYATDAETDGASGARAVTPKGLRAKFGALLAGLIGKRATDGAIYQLKGKADGTLGIEERTQDAATATDLTAVKASVADNATAIANNADAIAGKADSSELPGNASATKRGIVELANDSEAKKGTDAARAVTPKALKAAAAGHALAGVPAAAATDKTYVVKRKSTANGGGLDFVEAVFRRYVTPGVHSFTVPAGVTRLRLLLVGGGGGGGAGAGTGGDRAPSGAGGDTTATHGGTTHTARGGSGGRPGGRGSSASAGGGGAGGSGWPAGSAGTSGVRNRLRPRGGRGGAGGGNGGNGGYGAGGRTSGTPIYGHGGGGGGGGGETVESTLTGLSGGDSIELVVGAGGAAAGAPGATAGSSGWIRMINA